MKFKDYVARKLTTDPKFKKIYEAHIKRKLSGKLKEYDPTPSKSAVKRTKVVAPNLYVPTRRSFSD